MNQFPRLTDKERTKIKQYIKNGLDISPLIINKDIRGEDFSYAIIKTFNRVGEDISGLRVSKAIIGEVGKTTNLSSSIIRNCQFDDVQFLGRILMKRCDCRGTNFSGALMHNLEYQHTNFEDCKFCETAIRVGTVYGRGAKFSQDFFADLAKYWNVKIIKKTKEEMEQISKEE